MVKFGWWFLKADDSYVKFHAYVYICHFVEHYPVPAKIILQVLMALLRASSPESRHLVKQSLDALMKTLPKRVDFLSPSLSTFGRLVCASPIRRHHVACGWVSDRGGYRLILGAG